MEMKFQRGQSPSLALNIGLRARISSWLDEMEIENYTINEDFTIDVDGNVYLVGKLDGNWPSFIKFGKVDGHFACSSSNLTSLKGSPKYVADYFSCQFNRLTSLKGSPKYIVNSFYCSHNKLSSLEGAPEFINGNFHCWGNQVHFTEEDIRKVSNIKGEIHNI